MQRETNQKDVKMLNSEELNTILLVIIVICIGVLVILKVVDMVRAASTLASSEYQMRTVSDNSLQDEDDVESDCVENFAAAKKSVIPARIGPIVNAKKGKKVVPKASTAAKILEKKLLKESYDEDENDVVKEEYVIDIFKAEWCGYCKQLQGFFENELKSLVHNGATDSRKVVQLRMFECGNSETMAPEVKYRMPKENIPGFPSIVISKKDSEGDYYSKLEDLIVRKRDSLEEWKTALKKVYKMNHQVETDDVCVQLFNL